MWVTTKIFTLAAANFIFFNQFNHNHSKRKDSLETGTELAVLRTYVENQAILEPILL